MRFKLFSNLFRGFFVAGLIISLFLYFFEIIINKNIDSTKPAVKNGLKTGQKRAKKLFLTSGNCFKMRIRRKNKVLSPLLNITKPLYSKGFRQFGPNYRVSFGAGYFNSQH